MARRWYVVHAYSGLERQVMLSLQKLIEEAAAADPGLREKFGDVLVPTEKVFQMRAGQKRKSERKFFPGYVLIEMELDDQTYQMVRGIPKVIGFLGGDKPSPITEKEAMAIVQQAQAGVEQARPKVLFEHGEVVRVISGPFADFNGVVEEVNYEKSRLRVSVLIFGRSTPVELEFSQVEKS